MLYVFMLHKIERMELLLAVGCGFLYVIFDHEEEKECNMTLIIFAEAFTVIEML